MEKCIFAAKTRPEKCINLGKTRPEKCQIVENQYYTKS